MDRRGLFSHQMKPTESMNLMMNFLARVPLAVGVCSIMLTAEGLQAAEVKKGAKPTPVPKAEAASKKAGKATPAPKATKATPVPKAEKVEPPSAKKSDKLSKDGEQALQTLLSARTFQDVEIGSRGGISNGVKAFRVLLKDPAGDRAFKELLENGSKPGQLYGLCGVYFTDPASFRAAAERLHDAPTETVPYEVGGTMGEELVSTLILSKEEDAVRLKGSKDSVREWLRRTGKKSYRADIFGGAIPMAFRGEAAK